MARLAPRFQIRTVPSLDHGRARSAFGLAINQARREASVDQQQRVAATRSVGRQPNERPARTLFQRGAVDMSPPVRRRLHKRQLARRRPPARGRGRRAFQHGDAPETHRKRPKNQLPIDPLLPSGPPVIFLRSLDVRPTPTPALALSGPCVQRSGRSAKFPLCRFRNPWAAAPRPARWVGARGVQAALSAPGRPRIWPARWVDSECWTMDGHRECTASTGQLPELPSRTIFLHVPRSDHLRAVAS